jgi:hypothetical protein
MAYAGDFEAFARAVLGDEECDRIRREAEERMTPLALDAMVIVQDGWKDIQREWTELFWGKKE